MEGNDAHMPPLMLHRSIQLRTISVFTFRAVTCKSTSDQITLKVTKKNAFPLTASYTDLPGLVDMAVGARETAARGPATGELDGAVDVFDVPTVFLATL